MLTHALTRVYKEKVDVFNFNYASFDGTTLPNMSGCDYTNACFSYIIDREDFRKSMFHSKPMEDKLASIDKFISKNLGSMKAVEEFFESYVTLAGDKDEGEAEGEKEDEKDDKTEKEDEGED